MRPFRKIMTPVSKPVQRRVRQKTQGGGTGPPGMVQPKGRSGMADSHLSGRTGNSAIDARASAFVEARLAGRSLPVYPGDMPDSLEEAYAIQSAAISAWPDRVAG